MLSQEENRLVTRTGPMTPAGEVLRRYWQPAALVEELSEERPIKALTLLGEDLVLFRDEQGRYGLLGRHCSHRGADLSYGRLEDGGLRCLYHGWLYNVDGRCLEQPAEPEMSQFCDKIRHTAYPCEVRNGIVFTYMGPGAPPRFPASDCFIAPDAFTFAFKGRIDCNWLQALEGGGSIRVTSHFYIVFLSMKSRIQDTVSSFAITPRAPISPSPKSYATSHGPNSKSSARRTGCDSLPYDASTQRACICGSRT